MSPVLGTNPLEQTFFRPTEGVRPAPGPDAAPAAAKAGPTAPPAAPPPHLQAVAFRVGGVLFGVDIRNVSCIVRMVEVTDVPRAAEYVEGIIDLRGKIVPLLSLQRLFGWPVAADPTDMYIVVGELGANRLAVMAESLGTLREVPADRLERPAQNNALSQMLSWVAKLDDGIMFVLDFERLAALVADPKLGAELGLRCDTAEARQRNLSPEAARVLRERANDLRLTVADEDDEFREFVTFALGNETYAIDVGNARKVLAVPPVTLVPGATDHFAGIINYAGDTLWVIDVKRLLGLPQSLAGNDERVVVVEYGGAEFGFLADAVYNVASFPAKAIRPALAAAETTKDDFVTEEIYWQDDLLAVLDLLKVTASPSSDDAK